jgi:hypothetical protein
VAACEEVLVNAEDLRAGCAAVFGRLAPQEILRPAFDGGTPDFFALAQPAAADPVPVLEKDAAPEWLGRALPRQDSRKTLPATATALTSQPLARFQFHHAVPLFASF